MTYSMTGFSRSSSEQSMGALAWELRSVNHRYLDVTVKLPDDLKGLETTVRQKLAECVKRGKIECNLRYKPSAEQQGEIQVDEELAAEILKACHTITKTLRQPSEINVLEVLKWSGVVKETETDLTPVMAEALTLFEKAVNELSESRLSEGQRLQKMIEQRVVAMKFIVADEKKRRPEIVKKTREKLLARIEELSINCDKERFEQELAYLVQKMDVDEELDRLGSHFSEIEKIFKRDEPIGRRLDFIMQELNREANTLGSKSVDILTTQASVELKVLIEQMREQVQNIE